MTRLLLLDYRNQLERQRGLAWVVLTRRWQGQIVGSQNAIPDLRESEFETHRKNWERKIAAVDTLLEDFPEQARQPVVKEVPAICGGLVGENGKVNMNKQAPTIVELVRKALRLVKRQFTANDLADLINSSLHPAETISANDLSNPLWSLTKSGKVVIVKRGRGRRPNIYVKR